MSRVKGFDLVTIGVVSLVGIYTGARFFEPIVVGQLEKDGHLRTDIGVPKYDSEGNIVIDDRVAGDMGTINTGTPPTSGTSPSATTNHEIPK